VADVQIISVGGPTETTLWNIWYPIKSIESTWKSIPYGKPIANNNYHILNSQWQDCPVWVTGKLFCSGVGVCKGYVNDQKYLIGFYLTDKNHISEEKIRTHLRNFLPRFMLPAKFQKLDRFPLTANAKIDRRQLSCFPIDPGNQEKNSIAGSPVEADLTTLFSSILHNKIEYIDLDFFEAGGNSITAMRLISRIKELYQVELSIVDLFQNSTIKALVDCIVCCLARNLDPETLAGIINNIKTLDSEIVERELNKEYRKIFI
jgi:acyl carrier protein